MTGNAIRLKYHSLFSRIDLDHSRQLECSLQSIGSPHATTSSAITRPSYRLVDTWKTVCPRLYYSAPFHRQLCFSDCLCADSLSFSAPKPSRLPKPFPSLAATVLAIDTHLGRHHPRLEDTPYSHSKLQPSPPNLNAIHSRGR